MIKPPFRLCTQNAALYITAEKPPVQSDDHPNPEPIRTLIAKVWDEEHGKLIVRACNRDDVFDELVTHTEALCNWVEKIKEDCGIGTILYGHLMRELQELRATIAKAGAA